MMYGETKTRSLVKAVGWRAVGTITTALVVFSFTGKLELAALIGGLDMIIKIIFFFLYERVWNRIPLGRYEIEPVVLWFTGLSGSGKSTISDQLFSELSSKKIRIEHLDGDKVRSIFPNTGFTKEAREEHLKRVGFLTSMLEKNRVFVVASFVSPFEESRQFIRQMCNHFIEIHVSTPLEVCEKRDIKGLYAKARKGEIKNFTGIDSPYEAPSNAEITIDTSHLTLDEAIAEVKSQIRAIYHKRKLKGADLFR